MAQITVEQVYNGAKYDVMGAAIAEYLQNGRPAEYEEQTWMDMLLVKHALLAADKMKTEGDFLSEMTDTKSPSVYLRWDEQTAAGSEGRRIPLDAGK